jgi:Na+-driven multidrug efflux pump
LEAVFQTSFSLIDQIIVGRLGADAIAGVGLSNSFTFIVLLIYSALGTGSGALIAQAFGRKVYKYAAGFKNLFRVPFGSLFGTDWQIGNHYVSVSVPKDLDHIYRLPWRNFNSST